MADPLKPAVFVSDFRGLRTVSKPQDTTALYSPACKNNYFLEGSCGTRWGTITKFTLDGGTDVFHVELLILTSPFTKYYFFLMEDHHLYWTIAGTRVDLLTLPAATIMFKNTPYQNLAGFLAFSDGFVGTTAPYVVTPSTATGFLTSDGLDITDGKIVTLGSQTYTFKTVLTGAANEVLIASQAFTLANLQAAINGGPGMSSTYGTGTLPNPDAKARSLTFFYNGSGGLAGFMGVEAILPGSAGNSIATTTNDPTLSWTNTTLLGGGATLLADLMTVAPMAKGDMHATTISPGNITPGHHQIAILYVTRSGYFSSPTRTAAGLPDPIDFTFAAPQATAILKSDGTNVAAGETVTIGQQTYTFASPLSGSSTQTFASNVLTVAAQPDDGDTVTIGMNVYTFRTALSGAGDVPFEVLIQAYSGNVVSNLEAAINGTGTPGTDYGSGTPTNTDVTASNTTTTMTITAIVAGSDGNSIATLSEGANLSWPTSTMTGGNDFNPGGIPFEVLVGADAQHSLQNLYEAVTLRGTAGTTYGLGTTQNALATSDGLTSATTCPYYAILGGSAGNEIAALETSAHLSWIDTLTGSPITAFANGADTLGLILTNIPVHTDPQVIDRWVVMTQADLDSYFLFADIGDNSSTSFSTPGVNDDTLGQLTNVDDYFRQQSPLPGAIGLLIYHERLITWGDGDATSLAKISQPGRPQAFQEDTGFNEVRRDDGQRLVAAFVLRDFLYYVKERSLHVTSDNGDTPDTWKVTLVAEDVGTQSVNGVDTTGDRGFAVILDPKGIYLFTGAMPTKITNDIDFSGVLSGQGWASVNHNALDTAEIHVDQVNNQIMAWVPTGANTRPDTLIVGNYREGFDKIKWDSWTTAGTPWRSFIVDGGELDIATAGPSFRAFDQSYSVLTDNGVSIDWVYRLGLAAAANYGMGLYSGVIIHAEGSGTLSCKIYGPDGSFIAQTADFALSADPEQDLLRRINVRKERIFVEFSQSSEEVSSPDGSTVFFADGEIPSGVIDGINKVFTLQHIPSPALSLELFVNGDEQINGVDYSLSGNTITYTIAPMAGATPDSHICWYRYTGGSGQGSVRLNSVAIYAKRDGVRVH